MNYRFFRSLSRVLVTISQDALFELLDALIERPHADCAAEISLSPLSAENGAAYTRPSNREASMRWRWPLYSLARHPKHVCKYIRWIAPCGPSSGPDLGRHGLRP